MAAREVDVEPRPSDEAAPRRLLRRILRRWRAIVVVDYRGKSDKLSVDVKGLCGVKAASALVLDNTCDLMPVPVDFRSGTICLPRSDENSAAYLVTLEL